MDKKEQIIDELNQLVRQYREEVTSARRTWPKSIKDRALDLQRLNLSNREISRLTGISVPTLYIWANPEKQKTYSRAKKPNKNSKSFIPLAIVPDRKSSPGLDSPQSNRQKDLTVIIVLPQGIRIEGLDVNSAVSFIGKLPI